MFTTQHTGENQRTILSLLWAFVVMNLLLANGGFVSQADAYTSLAVGLLLELQIAMIILCRVLPAQTNKVLNLVAASVSLLIVLLSLESGFNHLIFTGAQLIGLVAIIWLSWAHDWLSRLIVQLTPPMP